MILTDEFEQWFKQYLNDNYLVEVKWSEDQPESIARQCARAAYLAGAECQKRKDIAVAKTPTHIHIDENITQESTITDIALIGARAASTALAEAIERGEV